MINYRLVADSCCEFTPELKNSADTKSVPLTMTMGDDVFCDNDALDVDDFVQKINEYKTTPLSACPSPQEYNSNFASDKPNFVVTLSSQLSGSYASAVVASSIAKEEGKEVHVFDSQSASVGELLVSLKIKELMDCGLKINDVVTAVDGFIKNMRTFFVLENLDNLAKSGRLNKIVVKIASVMQIRGILGDDGNGNIAFFDKARGTTNAVQKMGDMIGNYCKDTTEKILAIAHCNNEKEALHLKKIATEKYSFRDIVIVKTRGLSSMYANKGGIIIAF